MAKINIPVLAIEESVIVSGNYTILLRNNDTKADIYNTEGEKISEVFGFKDVDSLLKNKQKKAKQYNSDLFANKQKVQSVEREHIELIEYKENIFKRIFNKIRQFFHV